MLRLVIELLHSTVAFLAWRKHTTSGTVCHPKLLGLTIHSAVQSDEAHAGFCECPLDDVKEACKLGKDDCVEFRPGKLISGVQTRNVQRKAHSLALTRSRRLSNSLILVLACKVSRCTSDLHMAHLAIKSVFPSHFDPLACFLDAALLCEDEDAADADLCNLSEQVSVLRVSPTLTDLGKETRQSCAHAYCRRRSPADLSQPCCRWASRQCLSLPAANP